MMNEDQWEDLALFPLNTVLFPGMVLPLHVFEERYKLMIGRCLEQDRPFGVVLIREGIEAGGDAIPYTVGTTAVIAGVTHLDEGRMNLVSIGSERFRLRHVRRDLPYLVGQAEPWPLIEVAADQAQELVGPVRALFRHYLSLLAQAQGDRIEIEEIPDEPKALALLIGVALQVSMPLKQRLLTQPSILRMLRVERAILRREQLLLDYIMRTQSDQWEGGFSGLLAKN
ncbi:MAG: LON peptidase substrate-binding domain-containing protein [Anaerolineae bacterium]|jgi:Lon protease-like protein